MRSTLARALMALVAVSGCKSGGDDDAGCLRHSGSCDAHTTSTTSTSTGAPTTSGTSTSTGEPVADPFTLTVLDRQWITGTGGWDTQHRDVDFDLGVGSFAKVTLIVDLESPCFPFEKWNTDPPPAGHNWPAKCDAFDRTMGFIVDPAASPEDPPGFEALRSITPFGGPAHIEEDITDWANAHPGAHSLRAYINSWPDGAGKVSGSEGGWTLSVKLDVVPGAPPREVLAAISLFTGDVGVDTPPPEIPFTVPEGATETRLVYRVSGHGGAHDPSCGGPAEEFCRREHHVRFDGEDLTSFHAWRTDCSDYCTVTKGFANNPDQSFCLENPCGALQSVRASRANWCPGAVVDPRAGSLPLSVGDHTFGFVIDDLFPGGTWTVSAVLYAYGD
ncbi:MAG: hypothetical protein M3Y29_04705 [Chloroflexota bacterium]|nr:hypothetical protein [Chloroflexota bacterium]